MSSENLEVSSGKKIRLMQGVITKALQETKDTWTLNIRVDDHNREYAAGQFISIDAHQFPELRDLIKYFEYEKGKLEPIRAYSLSSAPHEPHLSITIKPEAYHPHEGSFPPLLSPLLASNCLVGRTIEFSGYAGAFLMPTELAQLSSHAVHLAAGSGIVPSFSILKDELAANKHPHIKHTLVYVNKTMDDIIFHDEICALVKSYPNRFVAHFFLTQAEPSQKLQANYFHGRPQLSHLKNMIDNADEALLFACGPAITKWQKKLAAQFGEEIKPRFMEWVQEMVKELKLDKKRYRREVYG